MNLRRSAFTASIGLVVLGLAACGSGGTGDEAAKPVSTDVNVLGGQSSADSMNALYKAAIAAGKTKLVIYGPGEEDKVPVYKQFMARYPEIEVRGEYLVGPSLDQKVAAESTSGKHVASLLQSGDTSLIPQITGKRIVAFTPVTAAKLDKQWHSPDKTAWAASASFFGHLYNTRKVPEASAPKGWRDLSAPQWKGQMTWEDPTKFGGVFGTLSKLLWDGRHDSAYITSLAGQGIKVAASGPAAGQAVASGQYAIEPAFPYSFYRRLKEKGAPVGFVFPTQGGAHLSPHYLALLQGAPAPDAAKLFMNWALTPEGQQATAEVGYYPLMPDQKGPEGYPPQNNLDLLKAFPLSEVAAASDRNLATVKQAFGAAK